MFASCCLQPWHAHEANEMLEEEIRVLPTLLQQETRKSHVKSCTKGKLSSQTRMELTCQTADATSDQRSDSSVQDSRISDRKGSDQSLHRLVNVGKYAAAHRELMEVEKSDSTSIFDEATIERVRRIGNKFNDAMRMLSLKPGDLKVSEHNEKLGLHWGLKLEGSVLKVVTVKDYDVDVVKMIALDLQRDMEDCLVADELADHWEVIGSPFPHDICWRRRAVMKCVGQKLDDVVMTNCVNALDESLNAICSMKYTLPMSATTNPHGTPIPSVASGFSRTPFAMCATSFLPLALGGDRMRGVRKTECLETKLSPVMAKVLGIMPGVLLKKLVRGSLEAMAEGTTEMLKSPETDRLLRVPKYGAEFLEQVRQELLAKTVVAC